MPTKQYPQVTLQESLGTNVVRTPAYMKTAIIECWGGGGKGSSRSTNGGGGGGSGGGYSKDVFTLAQLTDYTFFIGAGATTTANGEDTTFESTGVVAKGGGSLADNTATGAAAVDNVTLGIGGTTKTNGGAGGDGLAGTGGGGGGEGGATTGNGNAGANAASGGAGGTGTDGGDGGAGKQAPQGDGSPGNHPGGGGGGGYRTSSQTRAGGAGWQGQARYQFTVDRKDFMLLLGCG